MTGPTKRYPTRDEIEKADDRPWEDVPAPELGEGAYVRVMTMSANQRISFEAALEGLVADDLPGILLSRCVQNPETGTRMFTDDDAAWLNTKSYRWVSRAFSKAMKLNGIGNDALAAAVKN